MKGVDGSIGDFSMFTTTEIERFAVGGEGDVR
jgi:hypothetical protein